MLFIQGQGGYNQMTHEHNWKYARDYEYTFMQILNQSSTFVEKTPYGEWWICDCGAEQLRFIINESLNV